MTNHAAMHWNALSQAALGLLTPVERDTAVLYLLQEVQPGGRTLQLGDLEVTRPYDLVVFFVDLEPGMNWGHRCRYVLMDVSGQRRDSLAATFPPFLRVIPASLRLVWRGASAPEWGVVTSVRPD